MENDISKSKQIKLTLKNIINDYFKYPLYLITHPIAGWEEFKGKLHVAISYLVLMAFTVIYLEIGKGFLLDPYKKLDFNVLVTISKVVLPTIVGAVANWCVTALFDGKGKMNKIFLCICYSVFPFVWISLFATFLSNFVVANEVSYINFFLAIASGLLIYMLIFALKGIHEYGFFKNLITLAFTIVAIAIILFLALLFLSFIQQIYQWIVAIISEIRIRYF